MRQSNFWFEEGIGQLFMIGLPGTELDKTTLTFIRKFGVSKFILFKRNTLRGKEALGKLCFDLKNACREADLEPIIAVDQEGGPVRRLVPPDFPDMPSPDGVRKSQEPLKEMEKLAAATARILKAFSIDLNLAPVLDLCLCGEKNVLKSRCFGKDPQNVSKLASAYIKRLKEQGIMTCAKHFPGIGRVELDPHHHLPRVTAEKEKVLKEMAPFLEAARCGTECIMTSHVIFTGLDPDNPATFSRIISTKLLRKEIGFKGVLLSDDLEMRGAQEKTGIGQAALSALKAGHDLLLVCSNQELMKKCLFRLKEAIEQGSISRKRIEEAKRRLRLLEKLH